MSINPHQLLAVQAKELAALRQDVHNKDLLISTFGTLLARHGKAFAALAKAYDPDTVFNDDIDEAYKALAVDFSTDPKDVADEIIRLSVANSQLRSLVAQQQTTIEHLEARVK